MRDAPLVGPMPDFLLSREERGAAPVRSPVQGSQARTHKQQTGTSTMKPPDTETRGFSEDTIQAWAGGCQRERRMEALARARRCDAWRNADALNEAMPKLIGARAEIGVHSLGWAHVTVSVSPNHSRMLRMMIVYAMQ